MINLLEAPVYIYKQCKDPRKIKEHQETLNNPSTKASASFIHGPTRDVLQEEDFSSSSSPRRSAAHDGTLRYGYARRP